MRSCGEAGINCSRYRRDFGHSIFLRALLDALTQEKKPFTAGEMFAKLQTAVGGNSKQIPQYFPMKERHDGGELIFVPQSVWELILGG
jgi:hypothetical protein